MAATSQELNYFLYAPKLAYLAKHFGCPPFPQPQSRFNQNHDFAVACRISLLKNKNPFRLFERMGSPIDNLGRYISLSSEGLWHDPL